jgi:hypothetical protein
MHSDQMNEMWWLNQANHTFAHTKAVGLHIHIADLLRGRMDERGHTRDVALGARVEGAKTCFDRATS